MKDLNSAGRTAFTSGLVLCVLAGLAVGLRLLTKSFVKTGFSVDDAWIVVALLSFYVSEAVLMWGRSYRCRRADFQLNRAQDSLTAEAEKT